MDMSVLPRPVAIQLPRKLEFGPGCAAGCAAWVAAEDPASVLIITSPPVRALCEPLRAQIASQGRAVQIWDGIKNEPVAADLDNALAAARDCHATLIIALGGGSVMDVAKLVAALLDGRQPLAEAFGIGRLRDRSVPLACLPTTSGTGSEVSPIAIVEDPADGLKKGVISPHLVPDAAFVDPLLTIGMPAAVTASTGLDALTHCIEAYANRQAHPLVDTWALEGIRRISRSIATAVADGTDLEARTDVSMGSLLGGMCLGPVNTAAVHALAYPLGSEFGVAHGVSNAVLLAHVLEFNLPAAIARYAQIGRAMGAEAAAPDEHTAREAVRIIRDLNRRCAIASGIGVLGVPASALDGMARSAMTVQRLLAQNPREVTEHDARRIYQQAY
jgi:alcohol dehydrogenase